MERTKRNKPTKINKDFNYDSDSDFEEVPNPKELKRKKIYETNISSKDQDYSMNADFGIVDPNKFSGGLKNLREDIAATSSSSSFSAFINATNVKENEEEIVIPSISYSTNITTINSSTTSLTSNKFTIPHVYANIHYGRHDANKCLGTVAFK